MEPRQVVFDNSWNITGLKVNSQMMEETILVLPPTASAPPASAPPAADTPKEPKKRRKNLTGWPSSKRKRSRQPNVSSDDDTADDSEPGAVSAADASGPATSVAAPVVATAVTAAAGATESGLRAGDAAEGVEPAAGAASLLTPAGAADAAATTAAATGEQGLIDGGGGGCTLCGIVRFTGGAKQRADHLGGKRHREQATHAAEAGRREAEAPVKPRATEATPAMAATDTGAASITDAAVAPKVGAAAAAAAAAAGRHAEPLPRGETGLGDSGCSTAGSPVPTAAPGSKRPGLEDSAGSDTAAQQQWQAKVRKLEGTIEEERERNERIVARLNDRIKELEARERQPQATVKELEAAVISGVNPSSPPALGSPRTAAPSASSAPTPAGSLDLAAL